jgi:hypothetical protein
MGRVKNHQAIRYEETAAVMGKKEIIFFDQLGYGWVVDKAVIKMIHANSSDKGIIIERTLADLLSPT